MISHLSYPEVAGCEAGTPVGFSSSCMQSFFSFPALSAWRTAGGLTVADDLAAGAVEAWAQEKFQTYPQGEVAFEALMGGNDVLPLIRPWQWQDLQATIDYIVARYEADPAVKARVDDAARRVLTLKSRLYGGLDPATITRMPDYQGKTGQSAKLQRRHVNRRKRHHPHQAGDEQCPDPANARPEHRRPHPLRRVLG